eukprot:gene1218-2369_t
MHVGNFLRLSFLPGIFCWLRHFPIKHVNCKSILKQNFHSHSGLDTMTLEAPTSDGREYRQIELKNGVLVTLVRDEISEKASAALSVKTGAAFDPTDYPGMAHFTEHMLFLGTNKYPKENYYKEFLNKNGGSSNAGTAMEYTTYMFDINFKEFETAVDIFSQFFKNPLFNANATSREVRAVDAEDSKNRILDGRRVLQVMKSLLQPNHPYAKFSTGNARTLARGDPETHAEETRAVMSSFYQMYYQPYNMAVALVGPQSLNVLEEYAKKSFEDIHIKNNGVEVQVDVEDGKFAVEHVGMEGLLKANGINKFLGNNNDAADAAAGHTSKVHDTDTDTSTSRTSINEVSCYPFLPSAVGSVLRMRPVQEVRDISIYWPMPTARNLYRVSPFHLLSYILNYKGEHSAFALLQ